MITIIVAVLPAFIAALHGISTQAELERLAERYAAMAEQLDRYRKAFTFDPDDAAAEGLHAPMSERSVEIAKTLIEETLDWRIIHLVHSTELT